MVVVPINSAAKYQFYGHISDCKDDLGMYAPTLIYFDPRI